VKLDLPGGKQLFIKCHRADPDDSYISKVSWNGKPYTNNYITHAEIEKGGLIEIWLQKDPGKWGSNTDAQVH
jgi:putative alpha-1,2-mannosidase